MKGLQADEEVLASMPHIITKNKTDKICLLPDIAIPTDKNAMQKEAEKKLRNKNQSVGI
jgi:hypothetical protein